MLEKIKEKINFKENVNLEKIYNKICFILEFIISIIFAIQLFKLLYIHHYEFNWNGRFIITTFLCAIILASIIIINIKKYHKIIEKMFLTFAIPVGILYAIFLMPTYAPDENAHAYRAYQISKGTLFAEKEEIATVEVPIDLKDGTTDNNMKVTYADLVNRINKPVNNIDKVNVYNAAQNYFPTLYIFSAIAFDIGDIFQLNYIYSMYLGKLLNFIVFLALGYFSIKNMPFGKLVLLTYLMIPMLLHQVSSLSADSFIIAITIFFIAKTLKIAFAKEDISKKEEIIYYISAFLMGVAKSVYIPVGLLSLLIIRNKNINKNKRIRLIAISSFACIIIGAIWYVYSSGYIDAREYLDINGVNGKEQISFIIHNPITYLRIFLNTIHDAGGSYLYNFIGSALGWMDISVPNLTIVSYLFLLLISPFLEKHEEELDIKSKIWTMLIFLGTSAVVITALYIIWTGVGQWNIMGVQGRYFLPIGLLVLLCMCSKKRFLQFKHINVILPILLTLLNLSAIQQIIGFFMA